MTSIIIKATGASIVAIANGNLTSGMVGVNVRIEYDESWKNLSKTAVFRAGKFERSRENIGTATTVPWEVMRHHGEQLQIGLIGRDVDGNIVMRTVWATVGTVHEGASGEIPAAPNPDNGESPSGGGAVIDDSVVSFAKTWSSEKINNEISKALIVETAKGENIAITDCADSPVQGLTVYGKTTQDGTPTPDTPVELVSVGDNGSITVNVTGKNDTQSMTIATPNGLPGILVTSGGNYTDETEQQWVCDERNSNRGVHVQRVTRRVFSSATEVHTHSATGNKYATIPAIGTLPSSPVMSNRYGWNTSMVNNNCYIALGTLIVCDNRFTDLATANAILAEEKPEFIYALKTPIETPLTDMPDYTQLHTHYPSTTVMADGAGVAVTYMADTKNYIDNQIAALSAALLNA